MTLLADRKGIQPKMNLCNLSQEFFLEQMEEEPGGNQLTHIQLEMAVRMLVVLWFICKIIKGRYELDKLYCWNFDAFLFWNFNFCMIL